MAGGLLGLSHPSLQGEIPPEREEGHILGRELFLSAIISGFHSH